MATIRCRCATSGSVAGSSVTSTLLQAIGTMLRAGPTMLACPHAFRQVRYTVPDTTHTSAAQFDPAEFAEMLACAHALADLAAPLTLQHFRHAMLIDNKASGRDF